MSHRRIACRKDSATLAGPDILSRWQCLGWKGSRQIASSDQSQPAYEPSPHCVSQRQRDLGPFQMAMPERKPADRFERAGREMSHRRIACRKDSATLAGPDILSRWQCLGWKGSRQIASSDQMQPAYEPSPHCVSQRQRDLGRSGHPFQMAMPGMERKPADRFERSDAESIERIAVSQRQRDLDRSDMAIFFLSFGVSSAIKTHQWVLIALDFFFFFTSWVLIAPKCFSWWVLIAPKRRERERVTHKIPPLFS